MPDVLENISNSTKQISSQLGIWQTVLENLKKERQLKVSFYRSSELLLAAWAQVLEFCLEKGKWILLEEANTALQSVEEYNHPIFIPDLLMACANPNSISIGYTEGQYNVLIDLNKTAGHIEEYVAAVKNVRDILNDRKTKGPKTSPGSLASRMWFEKIYGPDRSGSSVPRRKGNPKTKLYEWIDVTENYIGKYFETMALRKSFYITGHPAPWWYLLEHGNARLKTAFNRQGGGGYAAPQHSPTHFVDKATNKIKIICTNEHSEAIRKLQELTNKQIAEIDLSLSEAEASINRIIKSLDDPSVVSFVQKELTARLTALGKEHLVQSAKFNEAVAAIISARSSIKHGFYFSSGERIRLKSIANKLQEALR